MNEAGRKKKDTSIGINEDGVNEDGRKDKDMSIGINGDMVEASRLMSKGRTWMLWKFS